MSEYQQIPKTGYLRLSQIIGDKKKGIPPIVPVCSTTWWAGVKSGRFPQPIKLSVRATGWRAEDILAMIANPEQRFEVK